MDTYKCFMRTEIDHLVLGDFLLDKKEQPKFVDDINWKEVFELDQHAVTADQVEAHGNAERRQEQQGGRHRPRRQPAPLDAPPQPEKAAADAVKQWREFGLLVGGIFIALGALALYRHG